MLITEVFKKGKKQLQRCLSKQFAQKGAWEHRLRNQNMPLQEKPKHSTWVHTAAQQTSHTNQHSISEGNSWSGESQKERSRNVQGLQKIYLKKKYKTREKAVAEIELSAVFTCVRDCCAEGK